jgi:hypothetical protein
MIVPSGIRWEPFLIIPPIFFATGLTGLAVLADFLNAAAVGAPFAPTFRIFSFDPAAMRAFLAAILAYKPFLATIFYSSNIVPKTYLWLCRTYGVL